MKDDGDKGTDVETVKGMSHNELNYGNVMVL